MVSSTLKEMIRWAENGDRQDPEDAGIDRTVGWDVSYEQIGSGNFPEREVFQELVFEITSAHVDRREQGLYSWDGEVDYLHPVYVMGSDRILRRSLADSGPNSGGAIDPTTPGQTAWEVY